MNCQSGPEVYPTSMDGVDDFNCSIWSDCNGGVEVKLKEGAYSVTSNVPLFIIIRNVGF